MQFVRDGKLLNPYVYDGHRSWQGLTMSNDRGVIPPMRYLRLRVDAVAGKDRWSTMTGYCMQISRLELVNGAGDYFQYPSATTGAATNIGSAASSEDLLNCLDHSTYTKMCLTDCFSNATQPVYVTFDFKDACLDVTRYSKWEWWTANDTSGYPNRNLKTYSLEVSTDGVEWLTVDSVVNGTYTSSNYSKAYEGNLAI